MAGIKEEKKIYLVGIYCRLSKDDGTDNESVYWSSFFVTHCSINN